MKVVMLAGGFGTRLAEETGVRPKPMVEIGNQPILWHIMKLYHHFGFKEFVVALGYKANYIKEYFFNYQRLQGNLTIDLANGHVEQERTNCEDWKIHLIDTGIGTNTGGRVKRLEQIIGGDRFMLTYGDGVCDVDISKLLDFHEQHGLKATITTVRPPARFGDVGIEGHLVERFTEKDTINAGWINGGFMVLEPEIFAYLERDADSLEVDLLERLADENQLGGFCHDGFWRCMDTLRDKHDLEELWQRGNAPWQVWD